MDSASIDIIFEAVKSLSNTCATVVCEMVKAKISKDTKADKTFVTEVDLAIEKIVRDYVLLNFPEHGIVGEENADHNPSANIQWIVDPIDGTQNLVHGIPTYGIVIGVFDRETAIAGAINHPILNLEYYAALGRGCYKNGEKIEIHDCKLGSDRRIDSQEIITMSTRSIFERSAEESLFDSLVKDYPAHRVYFDVFSTTRAVEGQAAAVVEFNMKIWDIAATEILINEAKGKFVKVREVQKEGSRKMYSIVAGKPTAVEQLVKELGGYKELVLK